MAALKLDPKKPTKKARKVTTKSIGYSYEDVSNRRFVSSNTISQLESKHKPCYFYHVSSDILTDNDEHGPTVIDDSNRIIEPKYGIKKTFTPRLIVSSEYGLENLARVCVAPTIEQCLSAQVQDWNRKFYVWRTVNQISNSFIPYCVHDAPLTQERWLKSKRVFVLVGVIERGPRGHTLYEYTKETKPKGCWDESDYISMDYDIRGSLPNLLNLSKELSELRKYIDRHEDKIFLDSKEIEIHKEQRRKRLRFNRG